MIETLCQVVIPTMIGLLRGFGRTFPGYEGVFLRLFCGGKTAKSCVKNDKNLVNDSLKEVAGINVQKHKGETVLNLNRVILKAWSIQICYLNATS